MEFTSVTFCGDQNRSAIAAVRGQMRESIFSGETYSVHIEASPPRIRALSSDPKFAAPPDMGSTA